MQEVMKHKCSICLHLRTYIEMFVERMYNIKAGKKGLNKTNMVYRCDY
jgi:hypothetical protein